MYRIFHNLKRENAQRHPEQNFIPLHADWICITDWRSKTKLLRAKYERIFLWIMLADLPKTSLLWESSSAIWPALRKTFVLPICNSKQYKNITKTNPEKAFIILLCLHNSWRAKKITYNHLKPLKREHCKTKKGKKATISSINQAYKGTHLKYIGNIREHILIYRSKKITGVHKSGKLANQAVVGSPPTTKRVEQMPFQH